MSEEESGVEMHTDRLAADEDVHITQPVPGLDTRQILEGH